MPEPGEIVVGRGFFVAISMSWKQMMCSAVIGKGRGNNRLLWRCGLSPHPARAWGQLNDVRKTACVLENQWTAIPVHHRNQGKKCSLTKLFSSFVADRPARLPKGWQPIWRRLPGVSQFLSAMNAVGRYRHGIARKSPCPNPCWTAWVWPIGPKTGDGFVAIFVTMRRHRHFPATAIIACWTRMFSWPNPLPWLW